MEFKDLVYTVIVIWNMLIWIVGAVVMTRWAWRQVKALFSPVARKGTHEVA